MIQRQKNGSNERLLSTAGRPPGTRPTETYEGKRIKDPGAAWEANARIALANVRFALKDQIDSLPNGLLPSRALLNLLALTPPNGLSPAKKRNLMVKRGLLTAVNLDGKRFWSVTDAGAELAARTAPLMTSLQVRLCLRPNRSRTH